MPRYVNQHKDENHTIYFISETGRTLRLAFLYILKQNKQTSEHTNLKIIYNILIKILLSELVCYTINFDLWWLGMMFLNNKGCILL